MLLLLLLLLLLQFKLEVLMVLHLSHEGLVVEDGQLGEAEVVALLGRAEAAVGALKGPPEALDAREVARRARGGSHCLFV